MLPCLWPIAAARQPLRALVYKLPAVAACTLVAKTQTACYCGYSCLSQLRSYLGDAMHVYVVV